MGRRDAGLLLAMIGLGLWRSEAIGLDRDDLAEERDEERFEVTVRGKGRKIRVVYADNSAHWALRDWLTVRGDQGGPLFWSGHRLGKLYPGRRLSDRGLYFMFGRRAADAGVLAVTPHDMRRLTSDLLDAGIDIVTVSHILGHASVQTTARYDRRAERAKKWAASQGSA